MRDKMDPYTGRLLTLRDSSGMFIFIFFAINKFAQSYFRFAHPEYVQCNQNAQALYL